MVWSLFVGSISPLYEDIQLSQDYLSKDYPPSTESTLHLCQWSIDNISVILFLNSLLLLCVNYFAGNTLIKTTL